MSQSFFGALICFYFCTTSTSMILFTVEKCQASILLPGGREETRKIRKEYPS